MIKWPKEWTPDKGWLRLNQPLLTRDWRSSTFLDQKLTLYGVRLRERTDYLGDIGRSHRTLKSTRSELLAFYKDHGRRPTRKEWDGAATWLQVNHSKTIGDLCEDLGLPCEETVKEIQIAIRSHFSRNRIGPTAKDSQTWSRRERTLKKHGLTLAGFVEV